MDNFSTPMMKQYMQIKSKYQDCLLFFRMGDFYELFMEDAKIGSQILNITLTSKAGGKDGRIPMAGIPYHAVDTYLTKLIQAGFKVAICEQLSPPNKKGLVKRDVVRIVTPGTVLNENALEKKTNNYLISISLQSSHFGIAICDISTGYFATSQFEIVNFEQQIKDLLSRFNPSECILSQETYDDPQILKTLKTQRNLNIYCFQNWYSYADQAANFLKKHFNMKTLAAFNIEDQIFCLQSCAALLGYLQETQKSNVTHIRKISLLYDSDFVLLDKSTMINLELFSTIRDHDTRGSLLYVLDQTQTAMGGRLLKQLILQPLTNIFDINNRLDAVETLSKDAVFQEKLRENLGCINDVERLLSRLCVGLGNARDLINLQSSLVTILEIKQSLQKIKSPLIQKLYQQINSQVEQVVELIQTYIVQDPPISIKDGGIIKDGINTQLDQLRSKIRISQNWILELEKKERLRTGISSLKVKFNQVFGFYIDITKANLHLVPAEYLRKQTLVSSERFITPELKHHEEIILMAEEKINELEYEIFNQVLDQIAQHTLVLQESSHAIAMLDCLTNFSYIAQKNKYAKPKITNTGSLKIIQGRHPVVEQLLDHFEFVPNDINIDPTKQSMLLITGPNMAGKSVLIRQVALIVLMTQIGCFVPAQQAVITPVDRIFVRSGASDIITSGLSTFMVEMVETAFILHHATNKSLIIMDEIGRGTSTYDGISIAWAIAEYLATLQQQSPKVLFATHYHELQELENNFPNIKNYHMAVENQDNAPIFLYTLLPGSAPSSFGIAVAKLAGIPPAVIEKAVSILKDLETNRQHFDPKSATHLVSNIEPINIIETLITKELEQIDIHQTTPLDALNKLAELKEKIRFFQRNSKKYIEAD